MKLDCTSFCTFRFSLIFVHHLCKDTKIGLLMQQLLYLLQVLTYYVNICNQEWILKGVFTVTI